MKKSKWDIIGQDIDKDNSEEYADYFYYWYDGDYDNYDYYEDIDYEYSETVYDELIFKRGIRVSIDTFSKGSYIDMMSIYPKSVLRQKKIDYLLGNEKWDYISKPTIGDIYLKNKKSINEN